MYEQPKSFEDILKMIDFFYANKSRFEVMAGKKPYSNPNPIEFKKILIINTIALI